MHPQKPFPYEGEIYKSPSTKYNEIVFFVHFYKGNKRALKRHIEFVNKLGFDAFAFNLINEPKHFWNIPITASEKFGIKHQYADQIEALLNLLPQSKIVYSFSNPSASAIEALARRHCIDVKALICDSGPSNELIKSASNLLLHEFKLKSNIKRMLLTPLNSAYWSLSFHKDLHTDLEQFPNNFKILSIRGWKDKLIPPDHIDAVFEPHKNLDWRKLSIPKAEHLTALKNHYNEYAEPVQKFLEDVGSPIASQIQK